MSAPASKLPPQEVVRDALCELANIGSGNGITMLTRLLVDTSFSMSLTEWTRDEEIVGIPGMQTKGSAVCLDVTGAFNGRFLLLLDDAAARHLAARLLEMPPPAKTLGETEESALLETGNILASSFLSAVSRMFGARALPSPPFAVHGTLRDLVARETRAGGRGQIGVSNVFTARDGSFSGRILLLVDEANALRILEWMGVTDEGTVLRS